MCYLNVKYLIFHVYSDNNIKNIIINHHEKYNYD